MTQSPSPCAACAEDQGTGTGTLRVLVPVVVFVSLLCILAQDIFSASPYSTYQDDFYYYAGVARGFLQQGFPTFDGVAHTNGFHPLWQLVITLLLAVRGERHLLLAVAVVASFSLAGVYCLCLGLLHTFGVKSAASVLASGLITYLTLEFMRTGMEVILAIPSMMLLALFASSSQFPKRRLDWLYFGLLSSLAILSRVDLILFVLLLVALFFGRGLAGRSLAMVRAGGLLLAGLSPSLLYFLVNYLQFGFFLPISGNAKQLKVGLAPAPQALLSVLHSTAHIQVLYGASLVCGLLCIGLARLRRASQPVLIAGLWFPWLHLAVLSLRSDWSIFPWYYYGLPLATLFVCVVVLAWMPRVGIFKQRVGAALERRLSLAAALAITLVFGARVAGESDRHQHAGPEHQARTGMAIARWSAAHAGIYAMGDRAGIVGWLLPHGLVQTEGLTMDGAFLRSIRSRADLIDVLRSRHVRYYIASDVAQLDGCFDLDEPRGAGPASPKLRAVVCEAPAYVVCDKVGQSGMCSEDGVLSTAVFDISDVYRGVDGSWRQQGPPGM